MMKENMAHPEKTKRRRCFLMPQKKAAASLFYFIFSDVVWAQMHNTAPPAFILFLFKIQYSNYIYVVGYMEESKSTTHNSLRSLRSFLLLGTRGGGRRPNGIRHHMVCWAVFFPPLENKKNAPAILSSSLAICVFLDWMSDGGAAEVVAFDRSPMYLTP